MKKTIELFGKLGAAYGYLWQNQFKDVDMFNFAKKLWSKKIESFSDEEINFAFEKCLRNLEFPPTLSQFLKCCEIDAGDLGFYHWKKAYILRNEYEIAKKIADRIFAYNPWGSNTTEKQDEEKFKVEYQKFTDAQIESYKNNKGKKLQFIKQKLLPKEKENVTQITNILPKVAHG